MKICIYTRKQECDDDPECNASTECLGCGLKHDLSPLDGWQVVLYGESKLIDGRWQIVEEVIPLSQAIQENKEGFLGRKE